MRFTSVSKIPTFTPEITIGIVAALVLIVIVLVVILKKRGG